MFTSKEVDDIKKLREFAELNIISEAYSRKQLEGQVPAVGDGTMFQVFAKEMRIVFSVMEVSNEPYRRMSISTKIGGRIELTDELLNEFGFHKHGQMNIWTDKIPPYGTIVNVLQKCHTDEVIDGNKLLRKASSEEQVRPLP